MGTVTLVLTSLKECVHIIFLDSVYRRARVQGGYIQVQSAVMNPTSDVLHLKLIILRQLWMAVSERFVLLHILSEPFGRFLSLRNGM